MSCACNGLQGVEATLDLAHIGTLHNADMAEGGSYVRTTR